MSLDSWLCEIKNSGLKSGLKENSRSHQGGKDLVWSEFMAAQKSQRRKAWVSGKFAQSDSMSSSGTNRVIVQFPGQNKNDNISKRLKVVKIKCSKY